MTNMAIAGSGGMASGAGRESLRCQERHSPAASVLTAPGF